MQQQSNAINTSPPAVEVPARSGGGVVSWTRTCWRGLEIRHPAAWELTSIAPGRDPLRMRFSDRRNERMTLQWRKLSYVPDLGRAMQRRQKTDTGTTELSGLPEGWRGTTTPAGHGSLTHAGRFFRNDGLLVECVIVWPGSRNKHLEHAILQSATPPPAQPDGIWWEAMGLRASIPETYELAGVDAPVGRVEWRFNDRAGCTLALHRLALPGYWLQGTLDEWLTETVAAEATVTGVKPTNWNGHPAVEVRSRQPVTGWKRVFARWTPRSDLAWFCPLEKRVYRVISSAKTQSGPDRRHPCLKVACCLPPTSPSSDANGTESHSTAPDGSAGVDLLAGVPCVNRAAQISYDPSGSAVATVPLRTRHGLARAARCLLPLSDERRIRLDSLGADTLKLCDGQRRVEQIAEHFATENRLTFREAQLSVVPFIRLLYERGVLAVVGGI